MLLLLVGMEVVKLAAPYAAVLLENIMYAAPVLAMRKAARVGRLQIDPTRFAASPQPDKTTGRSKVSERLVFAFSKYTFA